MVDIYLFNTLSRKKEKFEPLNPPNVGIYSCGPTVYDYASIGNFRTNTISDLLVRILVFNGFKVRHIMNITDVGHLTGDGDLGTDKVEAKAKLEGKSAWDIVKYYTDAFLEDMEKLNIKKPNQMPRATEHIKDQIELVKKIEEKGITYETQDGIYFNTEAFEEKTGKKYGELSTLDQLKTGTRARVYKEKKNPRDFALWKFTPETVKRQMEWDSPWGKGFPGWHIECSAMSMKYLGESFDIHVGGEDLRQTHHPNEIAQSETVTGKRFVKYWLHVAFLKVDGKKMSKSLGNFYTIPMIEERGYDPLALRYFYLTAHYRDSLNFTWDALSSAQNALEKLRSQVLAAKRQRSRTELSPEKQKKLDNFRKKFISLINDDINTPQALAVLWEMLKSNLPSEDKYDMALSFDEVLGLNLSEVQKKELVIPDEIQKLIDQRERLRKGEKFEEADKVRKEIEVKGFRLKDTEKGTIIEPVRNAKN